MSCPRGAPSDPDMTAWLHRLDARLEERGLTPPAKTDGEHGAVWADTVGPQRNALWHELSRRWIAWRDEAIRVGMLRDYEIADALAECRRRWEHAPRPQNGGLTPMQIVEREQRQPLA